MPNTKINPQKILDVSFDLFINNGYTNTSVRSIAKAVEISHGSLFNYFPSKAYIALTIVSRFYRYWNEETDRYITSQALSDPSAETERFVFQSVVFFHYLECHKKFARFLCEFMSEEHDLFLNTNQTYFLKYVQANSERSFVNNLEGRLDIFLLDNASLWFTKHLLDQTISLKDASVIIARLTHQLWQLPYSLEKISSIVSRLISPDSPVHEVAEMISSKLEEPYEYTSLENQTGEVFSFPNHTTQNTV